MPDAQEDFSTFLRSRAHAAPAPALRDSELSSYTLPSVFSFSSQTDPWESDRSQITLQCASKINPLQQTGMHTEVLAKKVLNFTYCTEGVCSGTRTRPCTKKAHYANLRAKKMDGGAKPHQSGNPEVAQSRCECSGCAAASAGQRGCSSCPPGNGVTQPPETPLCQRHGHTGVREHEQQDLRLPAPGSRAWPSGPQHSLLFTPRFAETPRPYGLAGAGAAPSTLLERGAPSPCRSIISARGQGKVRITSS